MDMLKNRLENDTGSTLGSESITTKFSQSMDDGAIVHCISVNEFVFKQGRITVPPAIALACEGYCAPSPSGSEYSIKNLPEHWSHVRSIMESGSISQFFAGGWRRVVETQRWWEDALAGVEETRSRNLALIKGIKKGMDGAAEIAAHI